MSKQKKILIITHSNENECIVQVSKALKEQNAKVYRFNSDLFPVFSNITAQIKGGKEKFELKTPDFELNLSQLEAIWYRRLRLGENLGKYMQKQFISPTIDESMASLWGALEGSNVFQFDYYMKHRIAANKYKQLQVAQKLGMKVPDTLITNKQQPLQKFYKDMQKDVIMKMQSSFAIYDKQGKEQVVFTNRFPEEYLNESEGLQLCPLSFQKNLHKKRELRVTVVGNKIFSAAVDSQKKENARFDWRKEGEALLFDWYEYDIPKKLKNQVLNMMDIYQLNYGAFDFIETPDNELFFLEVNSGGEYFWIDLLFKHKISEAIAEVLCNKKLRRTQPFPLF